MFSIFKAKPVPLKMGFFQLTWKVGRGTNLDLATSAIGAYVTAYAAAANAEIAVELIQDRLDDLGFELLEWRGPVTTFNVEHWGAYVEREWPEFASKLPTQQEVLNLGGPEVFVGAIAGFEAPKTSISECDHVAAEMFRYLNDVCNGVQEAKEVRSDAFNAAHVLGRVLAIQFKGSELLPRKLLRELSGYANLLENEAPYSPSPSRVKKLEDSVRQTFRCLIGGSAHDDWMPGVPRIS